MEVIQLQLRKPAEVQQQVLMKTLFYFLGGGSTATTTTGLDPIFCGPVGKNLCGKTGNEACTHECPPPEGGHPTTPPPTDHQPH